MPDFVTSRRGVNPFLISLLNLCKNPLPCVYSAGGFYARIGLHVNKKAKKSEPPMELAALIPNI
jgi:hypothetical protein